MSVYEGYNIIRATFNGRNGEGAATVTGLKAGDRMIWLTQSGSIQTLGTIFEHTVSNDNQLAQNSFADYSATSHEALFIRNI